MNPDDEKFSRAERQQRDALMTLLIAQANGQIQRLALVTGAEKVAIAKLVAISQAMSIYTRSAGPDALVVSSYLHVLESFSPLLRKLAILPDTVSDTSSVINFLKTTLVCVSQTTEDGRSESCVSLSFPFR